MKSALIVLSLLSLAVLSACSQDSATSLTGEWIGKYHCPDHKGWIDERVSVVQDENFYITATKITGDSCVEAGQITFEGQLTGAMKCMAGLPDKPNSIESRGILKIGDANHFKACNIEFRRAG